MPNQQLYDYIKQARASGASDDQIRQALLGVGWPVEEVENGLSLAPGQAQPVIDPNQPLFLLSGPTLLVRSLSFYWSHFRHILGIIAAPLIFVVLNLALILYGAPPIFALLAILIFLIVNYFSYQALLYMVVNGQMDIGSWEAYKKGAGFILPSAWISALAAITALGGYFLLVVPGVIISILLSQPVYFLFSRGDRGMSALIKSWYYVRGNSSKVFARFLFVGLMILILYFVATVVVGIISFSNIQSVVGFAGNNGNTANQSVQSIVSTLFVNPIMLIYGYLIFQYLIKTKPEAIPEETKKEIKKKIVIFMAIGVVGVVALFIMMGALLTGFLKSVFSAPMSTSLIFSGPPFGLIGLFFNFR